MPMPDPVPQYTLLMVDDTPTNLELLVQIVELDLPEVRVLTAGSAEDGLELARCETIDGAFIDVQMPGMDGLEMCRRLRADEATAALPIVLMTAHLASPELRAEGLEVGAYDFLIQPISNLEMLARIKVMLRLCENERQIPRTRDAETQPPAVSARRRRWLSGLLTCGEGALESQHRPLLDELAQRLPEPELLTDRELFEALARDFPSTWRRTLLKLALFDAVPLPVARKLSEIPDIEAVFDYLYRHDLVHRQERIGEAWLQFKSTGLELLREQARQQLGRHEQARASRQAAGWFERQGDTTAAFDCLLVAQLDPEISRLFSQQTVELFNSAEPERLVGLIEQIPDHRATADGWLALFKGWAQLRLMSRAADDWLELAYQRFSRDGDERGCLLTLSQQIVQAVFLDGRFERCAARLAEMRRLAATWMPRAAAPERLKICFSLGLAELFPGGRAARTDELLAEGLAEARQLQLPQALLELNLLRVLTAGYLGRSVLARAAYEDARAWAEQLGGELETMILQVVACELLHNSGDFGGFQQQHQLFRTLVARQIRRRTFAGALLGYYAAGLHLARGEEQQARDLLDIALGEGRAAPHAHLHSRILQFKGWLEARNGATETARSLLEEAQSVRHQAGEHGLRLENLLFAGLTRQALGDVLQAREILESGLEESRQLGEERLRSGFHAWLALLDQQQGRVEAAQHQARQLDDLLRRHRTLFFWGLTPELLHALLPLFHAAAERASLAVIFERQLDLSLDEQGTPHARLNVRTLGSFQVELNGKVCDLSSLGQPSRQIFALLITAPEQRLSIEVVMARLWPDSMGEKARNSFDTAHSRLRKYLEEHFGKEIRKNYLILEKGMLLLRYASIDSRRFSAAMAQARYHLQRQNNWQAEQFLWTMDQLWHGEFLHGHDLPDDLLVERRELTRLRLEQIHALADRLMRSGQLDQAAVLLRRGLAIDPLQDVLIRQLIQIFQQRCDERAARVLLDEYRQALRREDYAETEIDELIEALGAPGLTRERRTKER